jgi:hypothetical protein
MRSLSVVGFGFSISGRVTAYPEVAPKQCGSLRIGDDPTGVCKSPSIRLDERIGLLAAIEGMDDPG